MGLGPGVLFVLAALAVLAAVLLARGGGSVSTNGSAGGRLPATQSPDLGARSAKTLSADIGKRPATRQPTAKYGGLPSWLPKPKVAVHRVLHASLARPALSIEGEAISVSLPRGHVLATAVGPEVPEEGHFPVPAVTPCTFIVTFTSASRPIPLEAAQFTLVDERGGLHRPKLTAFNGGAAPREIPPGRTLSVKLHDILPTGDGGLRWAPLGDRPLATWDYTVEID